MKVPVEVFVSKPSCSGGRTLKKRLKKIEEKYGDQIEVEIHEEKDEKTKEYGIDISPAIVIDRDIRILGLAPSIDTLEDSLKEAGL